MEVVFYSLRGEAWILLQSLMAMLILICLRLNKWMEKSSTLHENLRSRIAKAVRVAFIPNQVFPCFCVLLRDVSGWLIDVHEVCQFFVIVFPFVLYSSSNVLRFLYFLFSFEFNEQPYNELNKSLTKLNTLTSAADTF